MLRGLFALAVSIVASVPGMACAEDHKLGMSAALSGAAQALGQGMKAGFDAALGEANEKGGVKGHKFSLVALDDGYEPNRTIVNTNKLIDEEDVLALVGNVGTPTATAALPIALEKKLLFYAAFTGAGLLRKTPPDRYVINVRASYAQETASMIDALLKKFGVKPEEIAFFTQNDAYGDSGYGGAIAALEKSGYSAARSLPHGRYPRNTEDVEDGLAVITSGAKAPKAVIMVGAYKACAAFIKLMREEGSKALFLNVSFVGSDALLKELGADGEGVIVTQVVPHPEAELPAVKDYRAALAKHGGGATPGFVSLEGYLAGRLLLEGVQKVEGELNREKLVDGLESIKEVDLGIGTPITLNKTEHQALHRIWPTQVKGGKWVSVEDWQGVSLPW